MCSTAFKELMLDRDNFEFIAEIKRRLEAALCYNDVLKVESYRTTLKALGYKEK